MENKKEIIIKFFNIENLYVDIINSGYKSLEQIDNFLRFNNFCLAYRILLDKFFKENIDKKRENIRECKWFNIANKKYCSEKKDKPCKDCDKLLPNPSSKAFIRYKLFDTLSDENLSAFKDIDVDKNINEINKKIEYINNCVHLRSEKRNKKEEELSNFEREQIEKEKIEKGKNGIEESVIKIINIYENLKKMKNKILTEQLYSAFREYLLGNKCNYMKELNFSDIDYFYIKSTECIEIKNNDTKLKIMGIIVFKSENNTILENQEHIFKSEINVLNMFDSKETFFKIESINNFSIKNSYQKGSAVDINLFYDK